MKSIAVASLMFVSTSALANGQTWTPNLPDYNKAQQSQQQGQSQHQQQAQQTRQETAQDNQQITDVSVNLEHVSSPNGSGGTSYSDDSMFLSFATTIPEIADCIVSKQAGGASNNVGGIFTWGNINKECMLNKKVQQYQDIEIVARLECSAPYFRNAIADHLDRRYRKSYCIEFMMAKLTQQAQQFKAIEVLEQKLLAEQESKARLTEAFEESIGIKGGK